MSDHWGNDDKDGVRVIDREKEKQKVEPPKQYSVIMHNDDFTPMDFVVELLTSFFGKTPDAAARIMLDVHTKGKAIAGGPYSRDIAETKAKNANDFSQENDHPFLCTIEEAG